MKIQILRAASSELSKVNVIVVKNGILKTALFIYCATCVAIGNTKNAHQAATDIIDSCSVGLKWFIQL